MHAISQFVGQFLRFLLDRFECLRGFKVLHGHRPVAITQSGPAATVSFSRNGEKINNMDIGFRNLIYACV